MWKFQFWQHLKKTPTCFHCSWIALLRFNSYVSNSSLHVNGINYKLKNTISNKQEVSEKYDIFQTLSFLFTIYFNLFLFVYWEIKLLCKFYHVGRLISAKKERLLSLKQELKLYSLSPWLHDTNIIRRNLLLSCQKR